MVEQKEGNRGDVNPTTLTDTSTGGMFLVGDSGESFAEAALRDAGIGALVLTPLRTLREAL